MLLGHKANVTSVTVLTVWVEALEEKYLLSQQHSIERLSNDPYMILSVTQLQRSKGGPAETVSLMTHAAGSTGEKCREVE